MSKSKLARLSTQVPEIEKLRKDALRWRWWCAGWLRGGDRFSDLINDWEYETKAQLDAHIDAEITYAKQLGRELADE